MISPGASRAYARDARVCGVRTARVVSSTTASTHGAHRATVRVIGTTMRRRGGVGVGRAKATDDDEADAADDTEGERDSASAPVLKFNPLSMSMRREAARDEDGAVGEGAKRVSGGATSSSSNAVVYDVVKDAVRAATLVLVGDASMTIASVFVPGMSVNARLGVAFASTMAAYWMLYVARWNHRAYTDVDVASRRFSMLTMVLALVVVVTGALARVETRMMAHTLMCVFAAITSPLCGVFAVDVIARQREDVSERLAIVRESSWNKTWSAALGTASWAAVFFVLRGTFLAALVSSSLVAILVGAATRAMASRSTGFVIGGKRLTAIGAAEEVLRRTWATGGVSYVVETTPMPVIAEPPRRVVYAPAFTYAIKPDVNITAPKEELDTVTPVTRRRRRTRKRTYARREGSMVSMDMKSITTTEINVALNVGASLESELERVLAQRRATLAYMESNSGATDVSAILRVREDIDALETELRRASSSRADFHRAQTSYENDLERWMESIRAAAAVSRLDMAIETLRSGAAATNDDVRVKELIDQRAVWGLRLVSSQIHTIVELQDSLDAVERTSSARISELRAEIDALEQSLIDVQRTESDAANGDDERATLERRVEELTSEIQRVREAERVAKEQWSAERIKLEVELEASVAELHTATRAVDDALKAKMELLAQLKSAQEKSESDSAAIKRLESETEALQQNLKTLSEQLSEANANVEQINARRDALECEFREKSAKLEEALSATEGDDIGSREELQNEVRRLTEEYQTLRMSSMQKDKESSDVERTLRAQIAEAQAALESQRAELAESAQEEISTLKSTMDDIRQEMDVLNAKMAEKTQASAEYQRVIEEREREIANLKSKETAAYEAMESTKSKLMQAETDLVAKQAELDERFAMIAELTSRLSASESGSKALESELRAVRGRVEEVNTMLEDLRNYSETRDALIADIETMFTLQDIEASSEKQGAREASDLIKRIEDRLRANADLVATQTSTIEQQTLQLEQSELLVKELRDEISSSQWFNSIVQSGAKVFDKTKSIAADFAKEAATASLLERAITQRAKELESITSQPQYKRLKKKFDGSQKQLAVSQRKIREKEKQIKDLMAQGLESTAESQVLREQLDVLGKDLEYIRSLAESETMEHAQVVERIQSELDGLRNTSEADALALVRVKADSAKLRGRLVTLESEMKSALKRAERSSAELETARAEREAAISALNNEIAQLTLDAETNAKAANAELQQARGNEAKLQSELSIAMQKLEISLDQLSAQSAELLDVNAAKTALEENVRDIQSRLQASQDEVSRVLTEKESTLRREMQSKESELAMSAKTFESMKLELADVNTRLQNELKKSSKMNADLLVLDTLRAKVKLAEEMAASKGSALLKFSDRATELERVLKAKDAEIDSIRAAEERAAKALNSTENEKSRLSAEVTRLEGNMRDLRAQAAAEVESKLSMQLNERDQLLGDAEDELREKKNALQEAQARAQDLEAQMADLREQHAVEMKAQLAALEAESQARMQEMKTVEEALAVSERVSELERDLKAKDGEIHSIRMAEDSAVSALKSAEDSKEELTAEIERLKAELVELRAHDQASMDAQAEIMDELAQYGIRLEEREQLVSDAEAALREKQIALNEAELRAQDLEMQLVDLQKAHEAEIKTQLSTLEKYREESIMRPTETQESQTSSASIDELRNEVRTRTDEVERAKITIEQLKLELAKRSAALNSSWDNVASADERIRHVEQERDDIRTLLEGRLEAKERQFRELREDHEHEIERLNAKSQELKMMLDTAVSQKSSLEEELSSNATRLENLATANQAATSEVMALKEQLDNASNDSEVVLSLKKQLKEIRSALKNREKLLSETVFDPMLDDSADKAIEALNAKQDELDALRAQVKEREEQIEASQSIAGALVDEIRAELNSTKDMLSARETLANEVEAALRAQISSKDEHITLIESRFQEKLSSLEGEGALSRAQAENMRLKMSERDAELVQLQSMVENAFALRDTVETLQFDVEERDRALESAKARVIEVEGILKVSDASNAELRLEITKLQEEISTLTTTRDKAIENVAIMENNIEALAQKVSELQASVSNVSIEEHENLRNDLLIARDLEAAAAKDLKLLETELSSTRAELEKLQETHSTASFDVIDKEREIVQLREEISRLVAELESLEASKSEALKINFEGNAAQISELKDAHTELERNLRSQLDILHAEKRKVEEQLLASEKSAEASIECQRALELEVCALTSEIDRLAMETHEVEHAKEIAEHDVEILREQIEALRTREQEIVENATVASNEIAELRAQIAMNSMVPVDESFDREATEALLARAKADIAQLEQELAVALSDVTAAQTRNAATETLMADLSASKARIEDLIAQLDALEQSKHDALRESMERNQAQIDSLSTTHSELEQHLRAELEATIESKSALEKELIAREQDFKAVEEARGMAEAHADDLQHDLEALKLDRDELERKLRARDDDLNSATNAASELQAQITELLAVQSDLQRQLEQSELAMNSMVPVDDSSDEQFALIERMRLDILSLEAELAAVMGDSKDMDVDSGANVTSVDDDTVEALTQERELIQSRLDEAMGKSTEVAAELLALQKEATKRDKVIKKLEGQLEKLETRLSKSTDQLKDSKSKEKETKSLLSETKMLAKQELSETRKEFKALEKESKRELKKLKKQTVADAKSIAAIQRSEAEKVAEIERLQAEMTLMRAELETTRSELARIGQDITQREDAMVTLQAAIVSESVSSDVPDLSGEISRLEAALAQSKDAEGHVKSKLEEALGRETSQEDIQALKEEILSLQEQLDDAEPAMRWPSVNMSVIAGLDSMLSEQSAADQNGLEWIKYAIAEVKSLEEARVEAEDELRIREEEYEDTIAELRSKLSDLQGTVDAQRRVADDFEQEVEELRTTIAERDAELTSLRSQLEASVSDDRTRELESIIQALQSQLAEKNDALLEVAETLKSSEVEKRTLSDEISRLNAQAKERAADVERAKASMKELQGELSKRSAALDASWDNLSQAEERALYAQRERDDIRALLEDRLASKERDLRDAESNLAEQSELEIKLREQLKAAKVAAETMRADKEEIEVTLRQQIQEVQEAASRAEAQRDAFEAEMRQLRDMAEVDGLKVQITDLRRELDETKASLEEKEARITSLSASIAEDANDALEASAAAAELRALAENLKNSRDKRDAKQTFEAERSYLLAHVESLEEQLLNSTQRCHDLENDLNNQRIEFSTSRSQEEFEELQGKLQDALEVYDTAQRSLSSTIETQSALLRERDGLVAELEHVMSLIPDLELAKARAEEEAASLRAALEVTSAALTSREEELRVLAEAQSALESERDELKAEMNRLREELPIIISGKEAFKDEVNSLRRRIDEASQEKRELQDRLHTLDAQFTGVLSTAAETRVVFEAENNSLRSTIEEMNGARDELKQNLRAQIDAISGARNDIETQLREREHDLNIAQSEFAVAKFEYEGERADLLARLEALVAQVPVLEKSKLDAETCAEEFRVKLIELQNDKQVLEQTLMERNGELLDALANISMLEDERDELKSQLEQFKRGASSQMQVEAEVESLREELEAANSKRLRIEERMRSRGADLEKAHQQATQLISENSKLRSQLIDAKQLADDYAMQLSMNARGNKYITDGFDSPNYALDSHETQFIPDAADEAFVTACTMTQRIEIILRRRQQTSAELQALHNIGDMSSEEAIMLGSELEAMDQQALTCRETLATCVQGLNELRKRLDEEFRVLGKSPQISSGTSDMQSRVRELERALENASAQSDASFDGLRKALADPSGKVSEGHTVLVEFIIPFETQPGQRILAVGTWCDWNVQKGLILTYTKGGIWKGTMSLHTGSNYEYKYVIAQAQVGSTPGERATFFPSWGRTEELLVPLFNGQAHALTWQLGNNKAMALDNIHTDGVAKIEVSDDWEANPKKSPIRLLNADNELIEIVGSTALLAEAVDRADHALAEARKQVEMMAEVATTALSMVDGQLAQEVFQQFDAIRRAGSLTPEGQQTHHKKAAKQLVSPNDKIPGDDWKNIGYGIDLEAASMSRDINFENDSKDSTSFDDNIDIDIV